MIATMIISSTPQQKAFCIPVDLILHFLQTAIKTIVNADRLSTVVSTGHFLTSVGFDLFALPCAQRREKRLILLRKNTINSMKSSARTVKVAAEQATPNSALGFSYKGSVSWVERLLHISLSGIQPVMCVPDTLKVTGILLLIRRAQSSATTVKIVLQQ